MTLDRLRPGDVLAGVAGLLLLADLFAPWYREGGADDSAFGALSVVLILMLLSAALGVAVLALTAFQPSQAHPVAAEVWGSAITLITSILVLYRVLNPPGDNAVVDVRWGAFAGLALVLAVFVGIVAALRAEQR